MSAGQSWKIGLDQEAASVCGPEREGVSKK